jgi:uncharacterized protein (DUF3084 family)
MLMARRTELMQHETTLSQRVAALKEREQAVMAREASVLARENICASREEEVVETQRRLNVAAENLKSHWAKLQDERKGGRDSLGPGELGDERRKLTTLP